MAETETAREAEGSSEHSGEGVEKVSRTKRKTETRTADKPVAQPTDSKDNSGNGGSVKADAVKAVEYINYIDNAIAEAGGHQWALNSALIKQNVFRCCAYVRAALLGEDEPKF